MPDQVTRREQHTPTPGPWFWEERNGRHYLCTARAEEVGYLTVFGFPNGVSIPSEADARLIAAAPEMYDALREYLEWGAMTGSDRDMFEQTFRQLLAKIDGEA